MTELKDNKKKQNTLTGIIVLIFSYLIVIFAALHSADKPIGGGDTWVAMACGRYTLGQWAKSDSDRTMQMKILDLFGIHITWEDPFSAKSRIYAKGVKDCEGWVNQNWLSHIMFYKLYTNCGEISIVYYKFIQAILTALFSFWAARALKVNYLIAALCAAFGVLLARSYIDMRPNISTILMAIMMILVLFRWRAGNVRSILWMLPIMIVWSNVHGGFIYAIVVFAIACGAYALSNLLASSYPDLFEFHPWKEKYLWLLIGFAITILTPMIFSPFGTENLFHPLLVMFGDEGKKWRDVSEWQPLFGTGFGNVGSFLIFLSLFLMLSLVWVIARLKLKGANLNSDECPPTAKGYKYMPVIDLAWLGIIVLTIYMAISSRRFVFLAGVVMAPFMAIIIQQIFMMTKNFWQKKVSGRAIELVTSTTAIVSACAFALIFIAAFRLIYFSPAIDGFDFSVFQRMVGLNAQPVRAAQFLELNNVKGIVLNEWANGGYIPWAQTPEPQTGRPPCKVYMDGRAQAAYRLEHFVKWQKVNINTGSGGQYSQDEEKYRQQHYDRLLKAAGFNDSTPNMQKRLVELFSQKKENYDLLLLAMGVDPILYSEVLKYEGVTVVLAENKKSQRTIQFLGNLPDWDVLYVDDLYTIIFRKDALVNIPLFDTEPEQLVYPDVFSRNLSLADYYMTSSLVNQEYRRALDKSLAYLDAVDGIDRFCAYTSVFIIHSKLRQYTQMKDYFLNEYNRLEKIIESKEQFGIMKNLVSIHMCSHYIAVAVGQLNDQETVKIYTDKKQQYEEMLNRYKIEMVSGWLR